MQSVSYCVIDFTIKEANMLEYVMQKLFKVKTLLDCFSPIKCQCCPHIETSHLICCADQLPGFYMKATLALNWLITNNVFAFI